MFMCHSDVLFSCAPVYGLQEFRAKEAAGKQIDGSATQQHPQTAAEKVAAHQASIVAARQQAAAAAARQRAAEAAAQQRAAEAAARQQAAAAAAQQRAAAMALGDRLVEAVRGLLARRWEPEQIVTRAVHTAGLSDEEQLMRRTLVLAATLLAAAQAKGDAAPSAKAYHACVQAMPLARLEATLASVQQLAAAAVPAAEPEQLPTGQRLAAGRVQGSMNGNEELGRQAAVAAATASAAEAGGQPPKLPSELAEQVRKLGINMFSAYELGALYTRVLALLPPPELCEGWAGPLTIEEALRVHLYLLEEVPDHTPFLRHQTIQLIESFRWTRRGFTVPL